MKNAKFVQIAVIPEEKYGSLLYALDEDGNVFYFDRDERGWHIMPMKHITGNDDYPFIKR